MLGLVVRKGHALDIWIDLLLGSHSQVGRRRISLKERRSDYIHTFVGALSG
jgi:hypothetical protein